MLSLLFDTVAFFIKFAFGAMFLFVRFIILPLDFLIRIIGKKRKKK